MNPWIRLALRFLLILACSAVAVLVLVNLQILSLWWLLVAAGVMLIPRIGHKRALVDADICGQQLLEIVKRRFPRGGKSSQHPSISHNDQ